VELPPQLRAPGPAEPVSGQGPGAPVEVPGRRLQLVREPMLVERPVSKEPAVATELARTRRQSVAMYGALPARTGSDDVPAGRQVPKRVALIAGLVVLGGAVWVRWLTISSSVPIPHSVSADEICAAFRPFGVTATTGSIGLGGAWSHGCRTASSGDRPNEPERLSLRVTAGAGPGSPLEGVEMEGQYRPGVSRTDLQREMLWAASSVFTRLAAEVPVEVLEGIEQPSVSRFQRGGFAAGITHVCSGAPGTANVSCRVALSIQRVPLTGRRAP